MTDGRRAAGPPRGQIITRLNPGPSSNDADPEAAGVTEIRELSPMQMACGR
jgi:hypothetical protein